MATKHSDSKASETPKAPEATAAPQAPEETKPVGAPVKAEEVPVQSETPQIWRPWPDFEAMQSEWMDVINNFWSRPWPMPIANLRAAAAHRFQPALNVYTEKGNLVVEAALPGVDKKDLHIHATRDTLSISGEFRQEKKEEKDKYYHTEIRQGSFQRKLALPDEVHPEKVSAKLQDGILRITLPLVDPTVQQGVKISVE